MKELCDHDILAVRSSFPYIYMLEQPFSKRVLWNPTTPPEVARGSLINLPSDDACANTTW